MAKKTEKKPDVTDRPLPQWAQRLKQTYNNNITPCFILHGSGITDYADNWNINLHGQLNKAFPKFRIIAHWSLSNGVTFPVDTTTDPETGAVVESSPSQNAFIHEVAPNAKTDAKPEDLLSPYRDPVVAIQTFDRLLGRSYVTEAEDDNGKTKQVRSPLIAVIIHMAEFIVPEGDLGHMPMEMRKLIATMERWGQETKIGMSGNVVILTTRNLNELHGRLRLAGSKFEAIELPIPTQSDRLEYIAYLQRHDKLPYEPELNDAVFSKLTAGLSRVGIEDIKYQVPEKGTLTRAMVTRRKEELIALEYGDVITMLDPRHGFESVGGYDEIKAAFRKRIIAPMRRGEPSDWPGVVLVGPGGTGKTILAEATAQEIGIPAVAFNISKMKSKYVGESEKNVGRGIQLLKEMAPVICFIDEIESALPNRSDQNQDSGVSRGILAQFMPFLSDPEVRKHVQFIAATNRSDQMDSALKRVGRFDRIIPMVAPIDRDRRDLFSRVFLADIPLSAEVLKMLVTGTEGWTGAEILNLVRKAHEVMEDYHRAGSSIDIAKGLAMALEAIRPNTADIVGLTAIALLECNDYDLLPDEHRKTLASVDGRKKFIDKAVEYARDAAATGVVRVRRDDN